MTEEETKAVEDKKAEDAAALAKEPTEVEKQLAEKDAQLAKLATERDNYKKGMLKAKGKIAKDDDGEEDESIDEKVNRLVEEKLLDSEFARIQKEKDDIIKTALARNKELETAIKNRSQISTADVGSGSEQKLSPKDSILSDDKLKALKAKGWDDKKIELYKKNLMKQV